MERKTVLMAMVVALAGGSASAQDARVEVSGTAGWTWSDGVSATTAVVVPGVGTFGDSDGRARPYLLIGLGATQYGSVTTNVGGTT